MTLVWKADENLSLKRNSEAINQSSSGEEEETFEKDSLEMRNILISFTNFPYQNLNELYRISGDLIESNSSLLKFLHQINFFETFAYFLNEINNPPDKITSLKILLNLSRLPTSECLSLIQGEDLALVFLKNNIFSEINDVRYLSLKCLKNFAQDSPECRKLILFNNLLNDFYSLLIGRSDDLKLIKLIGKTILFLLLEKLVDEDIKIVKRISFDLIGMAQQYAFVEDFPCKYLCSLSEKEKDPDNDFIENAQVLVQFLVQVKNSKSLPNLMKFFFVRSGFDCEAYAFFSNGIFSALYNNFIINKDNNIDRYNSKENKIEWSAWLIDAILKKVNESIFQFLEIGFLEAFIDFSLNGNYQFKSASALVFSTALNSILANKIKIADNLMIALNEVASRYIKDIDSYDEKTIISSFSLILSLISLQKDPKPLLSLLFEETTYNIISTFAEQSENSTLREKAIEVLHTINQYNTNLAH